MASSSKKQTQCIVVYDDGAMVVPYQWDPSCEGALCGISHGQSAAVFPNAKKARDAINISVKYAALRCAQGLTHNEDFREHRALVKILPLSERPNFH